MGAESNGLQVIKRLWQHDMSSIKILSGCVNAGSPVSGLRQQSKDLGGRSTLGC